MKVLIPMAGAGSRFAREGYTFPKPLIDVGGKPMIQAVVENLGVPGAEFVFLVRNEHLQTYTGLDNTLQQITNGHYRVVGVDGLTEGAACTALLAKEHINTDEDLMIANSDQIVEYSLDNFNLLKTLTAVDGIVFTFHAVHPKWSFVRLNERGLIVEVAEKRPISDVATCGIYWYRRGCDFVRAAEQMISKNIRVNSEFYVAPAYNEMTDRLIAPFFVHAMHGIGTPEDLESYLKTTK